MEFPDVPVHKIITKKEKEEIIKYISNSINKTEMFVKTKDEVCREHVYSEINRIILILKGLRYFNEAKKLREMQKLFTQLSLNNQIYNELITLSFNFFHTYIALGFFS
jgi:hypothetical protein